MVFFEGTRLFVIFAPRNHLRRHKYKYIFYIFFSLKNWHYLTCRGEIGWRGRGGMEFKKQQTPMSEAFSSGLNPNQKHPVTTPLCLFLSVNHIVFWRKAGNRTVFVPCFCLMIISLLLFHIPKIWTLIYK